MVALSPTGFPCPQCSRLVSPCGVVTIGEQSLQVCQCDDCEELGEVLGVQLPVAVTWAVDATGGAFQQRGGEWVPINSP